MVFSAWCFSEIAEEVRPSSGLGAVDLQMIAWFHQRAQPQTTEIARAVTFLGSLGFLTVASLCGAVVFAARRAWDWLLAFVLTMVGGTLLNILLKHFFHRARPVLENPLVTLTSFGFPSGHTMGATLFYGLLALVAAQSMIGRRWRFLGVLLACVLVAAIGLTRIYLGAHYPSDVVGAVAAGVVWLTFCWTTVETFRLRRSAGFRLPMARSFRRRISPR